MRIGTTPTHTFTLPAEIAAVTEKVRVAYTQDERLALTKDITALTGNDAVVTLSQEDTLKFHSHHPVSIQLRVLTREGTVLSSQILTLSVSDCLERSVLQ